MCSHKISVYTRNGLNRFPQLTSHFSIHTYINGKPKPTTSPTLYVDLGLGQSPISIPTGFCHRRKSILHFVKRTITLPPVFLSWFSPTQQGGAGRKQKARLPSRSLDHSPAFGRSSEEEEEREKRRRVRVCANVISSASGPREERVREKATAEQEEEAKGKTSHTKKASDRLKKRYVVVGCGLVAYVCMHVCVCVRKNPLSSVIHGCWS